VGSALGAFELMITFGMCTEFSLTSQRGTGNLRWLNTSHCPTWQNSIFDDEFDDIYRHPSDMRYSISEIHSKSMQQEIDA
jgi:hypothetical protein